MTGAGPTIVAPATLDPASAEPSADLVAPVDVPLDPPATALLMIDSIPSFARIEVPSVRLRAGEVLASIELATVCGSDLHTVAGHRLAPTPLVLGHEQVGRVVALGPGAPATTVAGERLSIGDRVVWGVAVDCGACPRCLGGYPMKCERLVKFGHERMATDPAGWRLSGGIATHAHLPARIPIVVVDERLPAEIAAPASCATATIVAALDAAVEIRPLAGAAVVVSGCGMLGLTAVAMASEAGAVVVAVDPDAARRALAPGFGAVAVAAADRASIETALLAADAVRASSQSDAAASGGSATPWSAAAATAAATWTIAIEVSGANTAIETLLPLAGIGGVLVLVGSVSPAPPVAVSAEAIVRSLVTIRGVHNAAPRHLAAAVDFLQQLDPAATRRFAGLVGLTLPLGDAESALSAPPPVGARTAIRP